MTHLGDFAILIPTRNRPEKVKKLLESISLSKAAPQQIVIVASGNDISWVVAPFQEQLPITYILSKKGGQVNQKKLGLSNIHPEIQWVAFLDDDVLVQNDTFDSAFVNIESLEKARGERILGVGFGITPTSRAISASGLEKILGYLFLLYKKKPGHVLSSGHATSYQESDQPAFTEWLNGVSMWRRESSVNYSLIDINPKYAACEDLIFSYPESKLGKLLFLPQSRVTYQDLETTNFENIQVIESAAFNRMFFVLSNSELSKWKCAWSQVGRGLYAIAVKDENGSRNLKLQLTLIIRMFRVCVQPSLLGKYLLRTTVGSEKW
jgi:glycosyltransferase involved in cell wall biosynthesis